MDYGAKGRHCIFLLYYFLQSVSDQLLVISVFYWYVSVAQDRWNYITNKTGTIEYMSNRDSKGITP